MRITLPNGKWRKRLKIKALPPFAELHKVRAGNCKIFTLKTVIFDYILGIWFAILMICFGIPGGYFFKNDLCTGAMMGSCFIIAIVRRMELDAALFALTSPAAYIILLIVTVLMIFISYGVALWIYSRKRYVSPKLVNWKPQNDMEDVKWVLCPICRNKTRLKIRRDTELKNFPLFCPKCRKECLINAKQLNIFVIKEPDA